MPQAGSKWHAPRVVPELDVLANRERVVAAEGQATHVREVARRECKNLAKQFQDVWREDGTLRNLHRQKWWYEDAEGVPPLASDVAGMMNADPGRFDVVDPPICVQCPPTVWKDALMSYTCQSASGVMTGASLRTCPA